MGFLLSKLLPLFVYPLGAGLLLMGLGLLSRRRRWGPGLSAAGIGLVWLASMPWLSRHLVRSLEDQAVRYWCWGVACCHPYPHAGAWRWPMPATACSPAWI
jgi:hypothetical protein